MKTFNIEFTLVEITGIAGLLRVVHEALQEHKNPTDKQKEDIKIIYDVKNKLQTAYVEYIKKDLTE